MGMIKTAHKEYPLAFLKSWANGHEEGGKPSRGNYCLLQTQSQHGLPFYALGWADRKVKTIISNVGSTNPGSISKRLRHKKELVGGVWETTRYYKEIQRPSMVEEFYSCFGIIDVHDHLRQGSLAMEREWYTHT